MTDRTVEVLLVHRPLYDDWSLPKGKTDAGDLDDEHTAMREVLEETGHRCALGRELPSVRYLDRKGREKLVRYWEMRPLADHGFTAGDEVDAIEWLPVPAAVARLTYPSDRRVLASFAEFAGQRIA
jgi:8-oxo-dGTP pyrophosphatase MutT (NUDIX family)